MASVVNGSREVPKQGRGVSTGSDNVQVQESCARVVQVVREAVGTDVMLCWLKS